MSKRDYICLSVLVVIYAFILIIGLGKTDNPNTFVKINKNEEISFYFDGIKHIDKLALYNGVNSGK